MSTNDNMKLARLAVMDDGTEDDGRERLTGTFNTPSEMLMQTLQLLMIGGKI